MKVSDFLNCYVKVETSIGTIEGFMKAVDKSFHDPLGCLILENGRRLMIVKRWKTIKIQRKN